MRAVKIFAILASFITLAGCGDLERTNPLDPKNPNSQRARVVLVEAFVNQSGGAPIEAALAGLARLDREFGDRTLIYLEHHIQKTADTDPWAIEESLTRYRRYVPQPSEQGIPDVFFDGHGRVQGASDADVAYQRYRAELERMAASPSKMTIEARATLEDGQMRVNVRIARLGSSDADDVIITLAIAQEVNGARIVRALVPMDPLGTLAAGTVEALEKIIPWDDEWQESKLSVVAIAQNSRSLQVYHSSFAELSL